MKQNHTKYPSVFDTSSSWSKSKFLANSACAASPLELPGTKQNFPFVSLSMNG